MMKAEGEPMPENGGFAKPLNLSGKIVQIPLKALNPPLNMSGFGNPPSSWGPNGDPAWRSESPYCLSGVE